MNPYQMPMRQPMGMDQNEQLAYGRPFLRRPMPGFHPMMGGNLPPQAGYDSSGINPGGGPLPGQQMGGPMPAQPMPGMQTGGAMQPTRLARMAGPGMGYGNRLGGLVR